MRLVLTVKTKIFGVIGDPVAHSLSPAMHGAALKALGIKAKYDTFHVKAKDLAAFFEKIRSGEIAGMNVTIPHKEATMSFCDKLSREACAIGAVNVAVLKDGKIFGDNTDGRGYLKSLLEAFSLNLSQMTVLVFGAGGASLAICHALCSVGVSGLTIVNRDIERAQNLIARLQTYFPNQHLQTVSFANASLIAEDADLVINATSLGMNNTTWPNLDFVADLPAHAIVSDIVYYPRETELLRVAGARGLKTHDGLGMLLYQGAIAFELFTGRKAPTDIMRDALEKALT